MKRATYYRLACLALILLGSMAVSVRAQEDAKTSARPDRGTMPNGTYSVSDIENISLQNGNVNLSIPLAALPPIAGGKLSWTLSAQYNSKIWNVVRVEADAPGDFEFRPYVIDVPQVNEQPWRIGGMYDLDVRNASEDYDYMTEGIPPPALPGQDYQLRINYNWYKVVFTTPDGAEHELRPLDYQPYPAGSSTQTFLYGYYSVDPYAQSNAVRYYSFDGSFIYAEVSSAGWKVYMPDGIVIETANGIQRIKDTNGNSIKIYTGTNETGTIFTTHYQDEQTGREVKYELDKTNSMEWLGKVWYQTVGGGWQHIDIKFGTTTVQGQIYRVKDWQTGNSFPCYHQKMLGTQSITVVREIVLPQTEPNVIRKYTFGYNSDSTELVTTNSVYWSCKSQPDDPYTRDASKGWGALNRVMTPSGAEVKYTYSQDAFHSLFFADNLAGESITKKELTHDDNQGGLVTDKWEYAIEFNAASVKNPDGSMTEEVKYPHNSAFGYGYGVSGLVFRSTHPFSRVERHWINLTFDGAYTDSPGGQVTFNPVVDAEYTTLLEPDANNTPQPVKMSAKTYQYDYNGNLLETKEYDWFDPSLVSRDSNGVPTGVPTSAVLLRTVTSSYHNQAGSAGSGNVYAKRVLGTTTPRILNAPQETTTGPAITRFSYDGQAYGLAPTLGNLTKVSSFDNQGDNNTANDRWLNVSTAYDSYGNKISITDANGRVTLFEYDNAAYGQANRVKVDPLNGTGVQTTSAVYDPYTGLATSQKDVNNQETTISYVNLRLNEVYPDAIDPFGRPGIVKGPLVNAGSANQHRRVTTKYWDSQRKVEVATDLKAENDQLLKTMTTRDTLGRVVLTEQTEDGANYSISSQKVYEQMGKITYSSNPTRGSNLSTNGWTRTTLDEIGRVTKVSTFSGDTKPPAADINANWTGSVVTSYSGNYTTVTDQAGKVRRSVVDALGRLVRVDEPDANNNLGTVDAPAQPTSYTYDVLGNLTQVVQGAQTRTFTYSSVPRLVSAQNPESGTIQYSYDNGGNLTSRTDARGIVTAYGYDGLNRVVTRSYSDSTPAVTYTYDTLVNGRGRLTSMSSAVSTTNYTSYDVLGRVTGSSQVTNGQTYSFGYSYDLSGNLKSQTYPSGKIVETEYDNAGRISGVKKQGGGYYAGGAPDDTANRLQYSAHGAITALKLGNGLWEHTGFNSRLQPTEIGLGTASTDSSKLGLVYAYGTTNNNGNVLSQTITAPNLNLVESYTYDSLNRLKSFQEIGGLGQTWNQVYSYDRYGNRNIDTAQTTTDPGFVGENPTFDTSNNRIAGNQGYSYDSAGNLVQAPNSKSYIYDGENKQTSYKENNVEKGGYSYDGDGRRVKRVAAGVTTIYVYNAIGQLIAEYTDSNQSSSGGTSYLTADSLGSTRVLTDSSGNVKDRHDYLPFGEEIASYVSGRSNVGAQDYKVGDIRQKFTQKERDSESGLDYFGARYYSSVQGRFTACDPVLITKMHIANPQRWNLYSYVNSNPLALVDPDGRDPQGKAGGKIIDIFITVTAGEPGPDFKALKQIKTDPSVKVNLYTIADGTATATRAAESLGSEGRTVIIIGHSTALLKNIEAAKQGARLKGEGLSFANGSEITTTDEGNTLVVKDNGKAVGLGSVRASNVFVFTCDTGNTIQAIGSNMINGGNMLYSNNGADGETGLDALQNAGFVVATDVIRGEENMENIRINAQINIDVKSKVFCKTNDSYCNRGDQIIYRKIE